MRKKQKSSNNLRFALYFILVILFFGGLSLAFKLGVVLRNSTFDGNHRYNLEFKEGKKASIVSFSPQTNTISIVNVKGEIGESVNKNLSIPIDAVVKKTSSIDSSNVFFRVFNLFPQTFTTDSKPTFIDVFRLMIFAKSVPEDSISEATIDTSSNDLLKQQILSPLVLDKSIVDEKKTIEIINSTEIPGLGARLAIILNNIGGNIILVVTSEKPQKESQIIYYNKDSYTVDRISSILGFRKFKKEGKAIADVIITIGEDQINTTRF